MTPEPDRSFWRGVLFAVPLGLAIYAVTVAGCVAIQAHAADPMACGTVTLPRTVTIGPGVDATLVRSAMDEWNQAFGSVFVEVPAGGEVTVIADTTTWVEMPCQSPRAVVHAGTDVDLSYWMAHELGHTLGLVDHIRSVDDASRYIDPGYCPGDGYDGIMSYCTPRERWFSPDDLATMRRLFPMPFRVFALEVAR